jgi:hypothetical protein
MFLGESFRTPQLAAALLQSDNCNEEKRDCEEEDWNGTRRTVAEIDDVDHEGMSNVTVFGCNGSLAYGAGMFLGDLGFPIGYTTPCCTHATMV